MKQRALQKAALLIALLTSMTSSVTVATESSAWPEDSPFSDEIELKKQKIAEKAFYKIPRGLSRMIAHFARNSSAPNPWLRRAHKFSPKYTETLSGSRVMLGLWRVNDAGDIFYRQQADTEDCIVLQKNKGGQEHTYFSLEQDWKIINTYHAYTFNISGIPISRTQNQVSTLAQFNMQSQTVEEIAISYNPSEDSISSMNPRSAIVGGSKKTCWISGNKRIELPHSDPHISLYAKVDPLSNRVFWRPRINESRRLLIKDFDQEGEEPVEVMVGSDDYLGDNIEDMCQQGNTLITSSYFYELDTHTYTTKIRFHTKDNGWQPTMVISPKFSQRTLINPITLNKNNSLALCKVNSITDPKSVYPAIVVPSTGAMITDNLDKEKDVHIKNLFFSPNGRWIAAECRKGNVFLWEVRGFGLDQMYTLHDQACLSELGKIYKKAKKLNAQCRLTPEQFHAYSALLKNPRYSIPTFWQYRLLPPFELIQSIVSEEIYKDPAGIVTEYLGENPKKASNKLLGKRTRA